MTTNDPAIQKYKPGEVDNITMTDSAVGHLQRRIDSRGCGVGMLLSIATTGCNGYQYVVDYIDEADAALKSYAVTDKLSVYVSEKDFAILKGTKIDYVREGLNEVFKFHNPNASGTCGCGESFNLKDEW